MNDDSKTSSYEEILKEIGPISSKELYIYLELLEKDFDFSEELSESDKELMSKLKERIEKSGMSEKNVNYLSFACAARDIDWNEINFKNGNEDVTISTSPTDGECKVENYKGKYNLSISSSRDFHHESSSFYLENIEDGSNISISCDYRGSNQLVAQDTDFIWDEVLQKIDENSDIASLVSKIEERQKDFDGTTTISVDYEAPLLNISKSQELLSSLQQQLSSATDEIDAVVGKNGQVQQNKDAHEKQAEEIKNRAEVAKEEH